MIEDIKGSNKRMAAKSVATSTAVSNHNNADFRPGVLKIKDSEELKKYMEMELLDSSLSGVRILEARQCNQEINNFLSILPHRSRCLEELTLANCELLEQVFDLRDKQVPHIFPKLKTLRLRDLPKLNCICNNDIKLSNLVQVEIIKCGLFKGPLPTVLLEKIVILRIESCEMIEQVVEENGEMQELLFLNLGFLWLGSLPNLTKFNISRCKLTFPSLRGLRIEKCPSLNVFPAHRDHSLHEGRFHDAVAEALFDTLTYLTLIGMTRINFLTLSNSGQLWQFPLRNLETMQIEDCNDLQYVFIIEGHIGNINYEELLFPALSELRLRNLVEFRGTVKQDFPGKTLSFEKLNHLTVCSCNKLRYVLPLYVIQNLQQLEYIEISDCEMLQGIFGDEEEDTQMRKSNNVHQLPQVKSLILEKLPKFSRCCQDGFIIEWLSLKRVRVVDCPMIQKSSLGRIDRPVLTSVEVKECNSWAYNEDKESNIEYLFHLTNELSRLEKLSIKESAELKKYMIMELLPSSFSKLRILEVNDCNQELNKFLSILLLRSHGLEKLTIENCELLEQVFDLRDVAHDKDGPPLFPKLNKMILWGLPKLNCIINSNVNFGDLVELEIAGCGFIKGPLPTALLKKLVVLKIELCEMIEQVVEENAEMEEELFLNLDFLVLVSLPKLTKFNSAHCHLTFPNLGMLWIEQCPGLNAFAPHQHFQHKGTFFQTVNKAFFDTLMYLRLVGTPRILFLTLSISGQLSEFSLPNLETMRIEGCNDLQYVFVIQGHIGNTNYEELLCPALCDLYLFNLGDFKGIVKQDSPGNTLSFKMLNQLIVCGCNKLRYVIPLYVLENLQQLENIEISDCEMLEGVFGDEELEGTGVMKSNTVHKLRKVKSLILEELPKFSGCCVDGSTIEWLLRRVRVVKCPMIRRLSLGKTERPLLTSVEVIECNEWANNEDTESNILYLFRLTDELSRREKLEIKDSEELKKYMEMELRASSLSGLRILEARQCDQELNKFLSILSRRSDGLEELTVANCQQLDQIFDLQDLAPDNQVPPIFPKLKTLRLCGLPKLNCIWNKDPRGIVELGKLVKLEIIDCGLRKSPLSTALLEELDHLKELKIESCEMIEQVIEDDIEKQERSFPNLKDLQLVSLPKLIKFNSGHCNFRFPELLSLTIEQCPKLNAFTNGFLSNKTQTIKGTYDHHVQPNEMMDACPKLQTLKLVGLKPFEIWSGTVSHIRDYELKEVEVDSFRNLKYIFPLTMLPILLKKLETLVVRNCSSLSNVFQLREETDSIMAFQNLKIIRVKGCDYLQRMLLRSSYPSLTEIDISDCQRLENIFIDTEIKVDEKCFPNLESIVLENLPVLSSFSLETFEFPKLQKVRVLNCREFKTFSRNISTKASNFMDKDAYKSPPFGHGKSMLLPQLQELVLCDLPKMQLWNQEPQISVFAKLTSLKIMGCGSLGKLFPISVAQYLSSLKLLTLYKCENMVQVLESGGGNSKQVFQNLDTLVLKHLPRLNSFCEDEYVDFGEFPELKMVRVEHIPKMKTFVKKFLETPKLKEVYVTYVNKCWQGDLNNTITYLHKNYEKKGIWKTDQSGPGKSLKHYADAVESSSQ